MALNGLETVTAGPPEISASSRGTVQLRRSIRADATPCVGPGVPLALPLCAPRCPIEAGLAARRLRLQPHAVPACERIDAALAEHDRAIGDAMSKLLADTHERHCAEIAALRRRLRAAQKEIKELRQQREKGAPIGWKIDRAKFRATPYYSDGKPGEPLPWRPLFESYQSRSTIASLGTTNRCSSLR